MKPNLTRLFSLTLLLVLGFSLIPFRFVSAQSVLSVTPSTIVNDTARVITVTGDGFVAPAVVLLDGTPLATNLVDAQTLTATVPAGVAVGTYTITVTVGGIPANGFAILQVNAPPTPVPPTPTATTAPLPFARPQFVVHSARAADKIQKGREFTLKVVIENLGPGTTAYNTQAVFTSTNLVPTKNGGVVFLGVAPFDDEIGIDQTFYVTGETTTNTILVVDLTLTYYDSQGTTYSDKFTLSVPVTVAPASGGSGAPRPTATPTGLKSSQLVISSYSASVDPLQPGEHFALNLKVQNVGNVKAQRITMIVGGGSGGSSGGNGTPVPGGVSGGSGDFANFAPVGASNVQSLGDLVAGETLNATQSLIVNVNTNPGAYPMRISFSYLNDANEVITDEQVITLLVYSLPNLDVSFYRPPDPFMVGAPGALPIQIVNLGKRLAVLGNMKVSAQNGSLENGTSLVGSLEAGGYFTLDALYFPEQSGPQTLDITIDYLDDFNQPRTIKKTVEIEVMEGFIEPTPDFSEGGGGGGDFGPMPGDETVGQKIWRFILGLLGLDSSAPSGGGGGSEMPGEFERPVEPLPAGGKG